MKKITITLFLCMTIGFAQNQWSQQKMTQTQEESYTFKAKAGLGGGFSRMTLNFYF
jgi:hypothetical protein